MFKLAAFAIAALIATTGTASANTMSLVEDTTGHVIANTKDATQNYVVPAVSEANGAFISFDFTYTGTLGKNDFFGAYFDNTKGPSFGLKANGGDKLNTTSDLFVRMGGTDGIFLANSDLVAGTHYALVGYLSKSGNSSGNYDTLSMWLNPTAAELAGLTNADIQIQGDSGFSSFTGVGYRTANIDAGVTLNVGEINVNAVPEPGTLALLGLGFAGVGFLRRRKQG